MKQCHSAEQSVMLRLRRIRLEGLIFVTFVTRFQGHIYFGELHYLPFKCMVSEEVFIMNYSYLQGKTQSPTVFYILGSLSLFTVIHSHM